MKEKEYGAKWFQAICAENHLPLNDAQLHVLQDYVALLRERNQKINLISRKDEHNIWERHILHCTSLLFHISVKADATIVDVGTGGGLPGIPLKILIPQLSLTLIDSIRKKTIAVTEFVQQLQFTDVHIECGRAEELALKSPLLNHFDYVIARSVSNLNQLVVWCFPFLKSQRTQLQSLTSDGDKTFIAPPAMIAMKGGDLDKEIALVRKERRVKGIDVINLTINGLDQAHNPDRKAVILYFK